jgi:hypothetical protein
MNRNKSVLIVILVIAAVIALFIFLYKQLKASTVPPDGVPSGETTEMPSGIGGAALPSSIADVLAKAEKSKAYVEANLSRATASDPKIYLATCPPLLYKVSHFDASHNWVSTTVLATSSEAAAAALGLKAGINCFTSSLSGTQQSSTYHTTGALPDEAIVASAGAIIATATALAQATSAAKTAETANAAIRRAYTSLPVSEKMAAVLSPATQAAYDAYKAAGGLA